MADQPTPPRDMEWEMNVAEALQSPKATALSLRRRINRKISHLLGKPIALGRYTIPPPIAGAIQAEAWANRWLPSAYREVLPIYEGDLPQKTTFFPCPILSGYEWEKGPYCIPPLFVLELPYGRTAGQRGATLTHNNFLIEDLSRHHTSDPHPFLHTGQLPPITSVHKGRYAMIGSPGNSTFHWLFDVTARFAILEKAGYQLSDFDGFLLRRPKYEAHYATLKLLGIPEEKIIWCSQFKHYELEHLVIPSFGRRGEEQHPLEIDFLRKLIPAPGGSAPRRRLYLSRKDAPSSSRRVVNEEQIELLLAAYGFESVTLSHLSFVEQAHLFASAEFIISPHGGGLSNLCFCDAPMKVIELFAPDYTMPCFRSLALGMGFDYEALVGEAVESDGRLGNNIWINPDHLRAIIEA